MFGTRKFYVRGLKSSPCIYNYILYPLQNYIKQYIHLVHTITVYNIYTMSNIYNKLNIYNIYTRIQIYIYIRA